MGKNFFTRKEKETLREWFFIFILAIVIWIGYIFRNCIFEWPPRINLITCSKEQWQPAVKDAVEFPSSNK